MEVKRCSVTGFCTGVRRALALTGETLAQYGAPLFILHDLVHNEKVVADLLARGVRIVDTPDSVPPHSVLIFSAHGVSEQVESHARSLPLRIIDATCPLVLRVHKLAASLSADGCTVILFGKRGHREVEGILGRIPGKFILLTCPEDAAAFRPVPGEHYACISQTTFNQHVIEEMKNILVAKIPDMLCRASVCHATEKRQNAVRELAKQCDLMLIVGSSRSSNTVRLKEVAEEEGIRAVLVNAVSDITPGLLAGSSCVGVASGASAPDELVDEICRAVQSLP